MNNNYPRDYNSNMNPNVNPNLNPNLNSILNPPLGTGMGSNSNGNRGPQIVIPPEENFDTEALKGSMQQILALNIGKDAVIEFLIGTQNVMKKEGIVTAVGRSYVILYEQRSKNYVVCDIFSVKFVTFY